MDDIRIERVLRAAECLGPGQAATYGDLADVTGESARLVGKILAQWGSNVSWWRVCNSRGQIPGHSAQALQHWRKEGFTLSSEQNSIRLSQHRVNREDLRNRWLAAVTDLG